MPRRLRLGFIVLRWEWATRQYAQAAQSVLLLDNLHVRRVTRVRQQTMLKQNVRCNANLTQPDERWHHLTQYDTF